MQQLVCIFPSVISMQHLARTAIQHLHCAQVASVFDACASCQITSIVTLLSGVTLEVPKNAFVSVFPSAFVGFLNQQYD